ncbi:MAG: M23 family metallopeptidase [Peptococcaceae bacterium]|nr:M23 family metallopeptidase [Peptococcaceae bacterium]
MAGYGWKLLQQTVGTIGMFFLILTVFQNDSDFGLQCQAVLRDGFTVDANFVMEDAVQVNGNFSQITETIAVPVAGRVISHYGWSEAVVGQPFAEGILIETAVDEEICAAYDGTVISLARIDDEYQIMLAHNNGLITTYGNCRQVYIKPDGIVKKGDIIGITANKSDTNGQLYFAAKYLGEPIDPLELFENMH